MRFLRYRWFFLILLVLAAPAVWFLWGSNWLAEKRWQAYADEVRARGDLWTLAEYRPEPVPTDEDAALLPIFAKPHVPPPILSQVPRLARAKKTPDNRPRSIDWNKTRSQLNDARLTDDPAETDDLRAIEKALIPLQSTIDQLCASKAVAANWGDETWTVPEDGSLPHFLTVMPCWRLFEFRAQLDLALNRPADARRVVEAHFRMAKCFRRKPALISFLVTLSGMTLARDVVWQGLNTDSWDDDTLRAFSREFLDRNAIADHQWTMKTERAWSRAYCEQSIGNPDKVMGMVRFSNPNLAKVNEWLVQMRAARRSWWRDNQIWIERCHDELEGSLDGTTQTWRPITRQFDPEQLSPEDREGKLSLAAASTESLDDFYNRSVVLHAQDKMAAIACALELHHRAKGNYPEHLDSLLPEFLPHLPIDPVTGRAFRYRTVPDGSYLLYSLGFDREDHGGKISNNIDRWVDDPDWVWFAPKRPSADAKPAAP